MLGGVLKDMYYEVKKMNLPMQQQFTYELTKRVLETSSDPEKVREIALQLLEYNQAQKDLMFSWMKKDLGEHYNG